METVEVSLSTSDGEHVALVAVVTPEDLEAVYALIDAAGPLTGEDAAAFVAALAERDGVTTAPFDVEPLYTMAVLADDDGVTVRDLGGGESTTFTVADVEAFAAETEPEVLEVLDAEPVEEFTPSCDALHRKLHKGDRCPKCGHTSLTPVGGEPVVASAATIEVDGDVEATTSADNKVTWEGILVVEGRAAGDGRIIKPGAITFRDFPLPLMLMTENPVGGKGHDGARLAGTIDWAERRTDGEVWGGGILDTGGEVGREAARLLTPDDEGRVLLRGISVDLDQISLEVPEGADPLEMMVGGGLTFDAGRLIGATLTPHPAFQEAKVWLSPTALAASLGDCGCAEAAEADRLALVAAAGEMDDEVQARVWTPIGDDGSLVASAATTLDAPPAEWFMHPHLSSPTPVQVDADGRVLGHVAAFGSCHIGFGDRCVAVPRSPDGTYRFALNKQVVCADGTAVATCPIVMDTVHPSLRMSASDAQAFYADTGCAVADVTIGEDEHGIWIAGAMRSTATPAQMRAFRGSDVSPDWRSVDGRRTMVGLLAVNTSGFITPALVASGGVTGLPPGRAVAAFNLGEPEPYALVAAGMVHHDADTAEVEAVRAELTRLRSEFDSLAERFGAFVADEEAERDEAKDDHPTSRKADLARRLRRADLRVLLNEHL